MTCTRRLFTLGLLSSLPAAASTFPGTRTERKGFPRKDFEFAGRPVAVVLPAKAARKNPWLWLGEFFGPFATVDEALLKQGWHFVYMACPNTFGSPDTMRRWSGLYEELVRSHGFSRLPFYWV